MIRGSSVVESAGATVPPAPWAFYVRPILPPRTSSIKTSGFNSGYEAAVAVKRRL